MALDEKQTGGEAAASAAGPLAPAARQRLQKLFEHATRNSEKNDFDYAHDLFAQCVAGDPASIVYLQGLLDNLKRKYSNNKKGSKMAGFKTSAGRKNLKSAAAKEDWTGAIKAGCEVLRHTPWDPPTLMAMAEVCEKLGIDECQLYYLRWALNADAKNPEVNKQAARTLSRMGQFDQAIACWHRVEEAKPGDAEAAQEISRLTVEKAVHQGGYSREVIAGKNERPGRRAGQPTGSGASGRSEAPAMTADPASRISREQFLRDKIESKPEELASYLELARLYEQRHDFQQAQGILEQALAAAGGGDLKVREQLEDLQMRHGRHQLAIAHKRAADEPSDEAKELVGRLKKQANQRELEIFAARVDRDPKNATWKHELGVRLKGGGKFRQAIDVLRDAVKDARTKAAALVEMGEAFQHLEEYDQALAQYQGAIEASEAASETRKLALYRAGVLATGLRELDQAEQFFRDLASIDAGYRDVQTRLDKVGRLRNKE